MKFRTLRPIFLSANSWVCEPDRTRCSGFLARYHGGKRWETYVVFALARRGRYCQPIELAAFQSFQLLDDQLVVQRRLEPQSPAPLPRATQRMAFRLSIIVTGMGVIHRASSVSPSGALSLWDVVINFHVHVARA